MSRGYTPLHPKASMACGVTVQKREVPQKIAVFWDFESCSLLEVSLRFREAYFHHLQGDSNDGVSKYL
jgi:hypothetical protein